MEADAELFRLLHFFTLAERRGCGALIAMDEQRSERGTVNCLRIY